MSSVKAKLSTFPQHWLGAFLELPKIAPQYQHKSFFSLLQFIGAVFFFFQKYIFFSPLGPFSISAVLQLMEAPLLSLEEKEADLQPRNNNRRPLRACKHGFTPFSVFI